MTREKTVILALGAAASLLFAPFLVGSLKAGKAQEENTMMNGQAQGANVAEGCHCAQAGKECGCKSDGCKSSCGGEGLNERCGEDLVDKN